MKTKVKLTEENRSVLRSMRGKKVTQQIPILTEQVMILSHELKKDNNKSDRRMKYTVMIALVAFLTALFQMWLQFVQFSLKYGLLIGAAFSILLVLLLNYGFDIADNKKK